MVGVGDGSQSTVAVGNVDCIIGYRRLDGTIVRDRHGLRGLGAEHQTRVTEKNPSLICTDSLSFCSAVMVKDTHHAIDSGSSCCVFDVVVVAFHEDIDEFVLSPHGWNPRLRDV